MKEIISLSCRLIYHSLYLDILNNVYNYIWKGIIIYYRDLEFRDMRKCDLLCRNPEANSNSHNHKIRYLASAMDTSCLQQRFSVIETRHRSFSP